MPLEDEEWKLNWLQAKHTRKGLNSLIILGAWTIWKLRNDCVFNGAAPSIPVALARARDEAHLWSLAGAKGLPLQTASAVP